MDRSWKIFRSESGICSLENRALEERSFYRMKVFLRNFYKEQYREEQKEQHKSFLFSLAMNLKGKDAQSEVESASSRKKSQEQKCTNCSLEFYIGGKKFLLTWDSVLGLVITAIDKKGNDVITSLEDQLIKEESWF